MVIEKTKRTKNKKAQLTVFIILGILVVAGLALYLTFNFNTGSTKGNPEINPDVKPIYDFVSECIYNTGQNAIYHIGKTGGYVVPPEPVFYMNESDGFEQGIAFYLYDNENKMPSREKIEQELAFYMDNLLYFCTNDFNDFPDFKIDPEVIKTNAKIENEKVVFDVEYPLSISRNDKTYYLKNFNSEVPVRLNIVYDLINDLMNEQMQKTNAVCISCMHDIAEKYQMQIKMMDGGKNIIFAVYDSKSKIYNKDYSFYFANKYE